jgi:8-oxo-dGTP pyrophosphatase MutT (NUDIX family)
VCRAVYRSAYIALRGYWFVRRPDVLGVKCVLTDGERVLLVRHTYGHREWDLPGGKVGRGEAPAHAAQREMHEELGVVVDDFAALGQLEATIDHRRDHMHCFGADVGGRPLTIDRCELAEVRWFPRDGLPQDIGRFVGRILALSG